MQSQTKRVHPRVHTSLVADVGVYRADSPNDLRTLGLGQVRDVGLAGLKCKVAEFDATTRAQLDAHELLLKLDVQPTDGDHIVFNAEVRWTQQSAPGVWLMGLRYVGTDDTTRLKLVEWSKRSNQKSLRRNHLFVVAACLVATALLLTMLVTSRIGQDFSRQQQLSGNNAKPSSAAEREQPVRHLAPPQVVGAPAKTPAAPSNANRVWSEITTRHEQYASDDRWQTGIKDNFVAHFAALNEKMAADTGYKHLVNEVKRVDCRMHSCLVELEFSSYEDGLGYLDMFRDGLLQARLKIPANYPCPVRRVAAPDTSPGTRAAVLVHFDCNG